MKILTVWMASVLMHHGRERVKGVTTTDIDGTDTITTTATEGIVARARAQGIVIAIDIAVDTDIGTNEERALVIAI